MLIIQARMGSKRLPGKVLLPLGNTTVIGKVIEACKETGIQTVVAIPDTKENDVLEVEILKHGVEVFRGSEDDVLDRYYQCAKNYGAKWIGRVTADCPFSDPILIQTISQLREAIYLDYASNTIDRTHPKGLDFECFTFDILERAHKQAKASYDREHVTPWIIQHGTIWNYRYDVDLSYINLSIDTEEDYRRAYDLDKVRSQQ